VIFSGFRFGLAVFYMVKPLFQFDIAPGITGKVDPV
jgi:hypothetical protein